jgi:DNA-binding transcriptional ArsR family regulator
MGDRFQPDLADRIHRNTQLGQGEAAVGELAAPFSLKFPTISKHLKVLQRAGRVSQVRRAQWRPCRLEPAPLRDVAQFLERYSLLVTEQHQRLDHYLQELQLKGVSDGADPHLWDAPGAGVQGLHQSPRDPQVVGAEEE